jgi:hypothetical protein
MTHDRVVHQPLLGIQGVSSLEGQLLHIVVTRVISTELCLIVSGGETLVVVASDLCTSSCHLWRIRIDATTLVVHVGKNPVSKVLPRREVYWRGRGRGRVAAAGDRTCCSDSGCRLVSLKSSVG